MRWIKKHLITILLCMAFLIGIGVMLYPTVSAAWNSRVQSRVVAAYDDAVANLSERDYTEYLKQAQAYNEKIYKAGSAAMMINPDLVEGYKDMLNISNDGIMGYVVIDTLNVKLPIYHGTEDAALSAGAGHLQGSSLPIGGENTHSVISAHRGLPNATMFTHLDKMTTGDIFELHVLGDTLYYQVDQITTVLPTEMQDIYITPGDDYCTLMTCTPYGINTHRLLVRGCRIESPEQPVAETTDTDNTDEEPESVHIPVWLIIIGAIILIFVVSEVIVIMLKRKNRRKDDNKKISDDNTESSNN